MKKFLVLPIMAIGLMVSQAAAAACTKDGQNLFCDWGTSCWGIDDQYSSVEKADASNGIVACAAGSCTCSNLQKNCEVFGTMYAGSTTTGEGVKCNGTVVGGTNPNDVLGYCRWNGKIADCGPVTDAEKQALCGNSNWFTTMEACRDESIKPPTSGIFCDYGVCTGGSGYNCVDGGCYAKDGPECLNDAGEIDIYATKVTQCPCDHLSPSAQANEPRCSSSPIITTGHSVSLTVVPNGSTLYIISGKAATVELFSMNGAKVFSGKVAAGNNSLSLGKQRQGVYYAVVKSDSQKQTVKVVLK